MPYPDFELLKPVSGYDLNSYFYFLLGFPNHLFIPIYDLWNDEVIKINLQE